MIKLNTDRIAPFIGKGHLKKNIPKAVEALELMLGRRGPGAEMLGWLDLPGISKRDAGEITDTAKRIQDENDCLVVIGIGGSYLGARAVIEALPGEARFPVLFAGNNLSPEYHERILGSLEGKRFAVCVISKSGTTMEPAIAFRLFRRRLVERFGRDGASARVIAITDPNRGALRRMAVRSGFKTFPIPPDVGGRFSVLSAVGLLPCAAAGVPVGELLGGAASAMERYTKPEPENDAVRYAAIRTILHGRGTATEVLSTFHPELEVFCEWWKQLAGESEGKDGRGLFPASTVMTTDLHSLGQYLQEGARNLLETFLVAAETRSGLSVPPDEDDLDNLNFVAGKTLGEVNRRAFEGTVDAHSAGGIPVIVLEVPSITASSVGALFAFFEIAVSVSGMISGINPFDQPGVEEYKRRMFALLGKPGV